jgi:perosamine synthetase
MTQTQHSSNEQVAAALPGSSLANGSPPATAGPNPPLLTEDDVAAAVSVLRSGRLGGPDHPEVRRFEELLASQSGVVHAVAVNSGTAALHCILQAMRIGPGDEVIVPAHTFIATATSVLMTGATPVVVDVDQETYCIAPESAARAVTSRTRAIVAVHLNGHPAPTDELPAGIPVISDACQAHGATLHGTPVGALGTAAAFSFWQDKLVTSCGEGGAILTDDDDIAAGVRLLRNHGQQLIGDGPNSHHVELGYNYRITGVQAAVGSSQLGRLAALIANRQQRAEQLCALLADLPGIVTPVSRPGAGHVYWRFVLAVQDGALRDGRAGLLRALAADGVAAAPRYPIPLTRQPVLSERARLYACPVAESLAERLLMLSLPATCADTDLLAAATRRAVQSQLN